MVLLRKAIVFCYRSLQVVSGESELFIFYGDRFKFALSLVLTECIVRLLLLTFEEESMHGGLDNLNLDVEGPADLLPDLFHVCSALLHFCF